MGALHSPRWHRVAALRPRLAPRLRVHRQQHRGETWYLLADPESGRSVRLNRAAWELVGRFDGRRSLQALWDAQLQRPAEPATQDEAIDLLAQLREAALVQLDEQADFDRLLPHLEQVARPRGRASLLAIRLPLADPSRLLDRLQAPARWLFTPAAAALWALAVAAAAVLALAHAGELWAQAQRAVESPRLALLAALLYLPIKLLHELGHGLAVRRWGGQVHEAGVTLMLGLPVPYVNASAATAFPRRRERALVSGAGIAVELGIAALALALWLALADGLARDLAFAALAVTGLSTLLFNGNPLQRLDGYYLLCDLLSLPNLAPRSRRWWLELLQRRVLGLSELEPMPLARGERGWLLLYAPLAWAYMLLVAALAVAWLMHWSPVLAALAAALLCWQVGLRPGWRLAADLRRAALGAAGASRRWRRLALGGAAGALLLLALPWPQRVVLEGVVWPADDAQLRADEEGFVEAVLLADGAPVVPGSVVLRLANPELEARLARQQARVAAIEAELLQALPGPAAAPADRRAGDLQAELSAAQAEREHLLARREALNVRAHAPGRLALPQGADLAGQYLRRGSLLGQVLTGAPPTVRAVLPEDELAGWLRQPRALSVRLRGDAGPVHAARLLQHGGGALRQLPSAALSRRHGGPVETDPRDEHALRALRPVVMLDAVLAAAPAGGLQRIGERAWVRLDGGWAPLALQWGRQLLATVQRQRGMAP